jgi:predicted NBD/HSP70 family sugar kinase
MYIVADIGGTKTRIAMSRDLASFEEPAIFDTPQGYDEAVSVITEHARVLAKGEVVKMLVAGVPRLASDKRNILPFRATSNLSQWGGKPLADDISKALGTPVSLCNDAVMVGLGEAVFGAGKGANIVVYITISTGVNGVRVVNGEIEPAAISYSIGDQYVSMEEPYKSWESLISGRAIHERFGKHPRELGKDSPVWEELARITAFGVHNSTLHWSPERVVIGGSMTNEIGISIDRVRAHLESIMKSARLPEVVHSSLGEVGGLYGGLVILKQLT